MSSRHHTNDNFVEQLLKGGNDASGLELGEAETEEVDYGETDEDIRAAQGHGHADRGRHVRRSPAGQGKHDPISWRDWQAPEQPRRRSRSRSRGPDLRRYRESHLPPGCLGRAQTNEYAREHADWARWRGERGSSAAPAPHHEEEDLLMRLRHGRSRTFGEPLRSRPAPHDCHWDIPCDPWKSAPLRHPGDYHASDGRLSAHRERPGAFGSPLPARSPPSPPAQRHTVMAHLRGHSPPRTHARYLTAQRDYAGDRLPHRHSFLLQRARPEEERLIIRRPLSPERLSRPDTWASAEHMNGRTHAAARRVEYDHHPVPSYRPADNYTARRDHPQELLLDMDPYWPLFDAPQRTESLLQGARGATPSRGHEQRAPARGRPPRHVLNGRKRGPKHQRSASVTAAATAADIRHLPPGLLPEQLPGPPVLPGPPLVPEQKQQQHDVHLSHVPPAAGALQAPTAQHMNGSHEEKPQHSLAANERAKSGCSKAAASYGVIDERKALETSGEVAADGASRDRKQRQSKQLKVEAEGQTNAGAARKEVVMHGSASIQDTYGSKHGKDEIAASKGAAQGEGRTDAQAQPAKNLDIQGHGAPDDKQPTPVDMPDEVNSPAEASKPDSSIKGGPKSTFVRDFYSRPERSASSRSAERKQRQPHNEAHGGGKGSSREADGHARSSEEMRRAQTSAIPRRDPLKELRERRGEKGLRSRSERRLQTRRDSPQQVRGSSRRVGLLSWDGDKPEDVEEWAYLDPSGKLQGPCSIASFRLWLARMKENPALSVEHEEFLKCMVWRKGMNRREPLEKLLAVADAEAAQRSL